MKYLVFGAGGTGGSLAAFLAQGGKDVSLIARGAHLEAIRRNGLVLESRHGTFAIPVEAEDAEHCSCRPDVILLCVKGYSLAETVPALKRLCDAHTIVIPILNLYGTGGRLQPELAPALVTDGCIYIAAEIKAPGTIHMSGDIFRVVFGPRTPEEYRPELEQVARDLNECGVEAILSRDIQRDALMKFSAGPRADSGGLQGSGGGDRGPGRGHGPSLPRGPGGPEPGHPGRPGSGRLYLAETGSGCGQAL